MLNTLNTAAEQARDALANLAAGKLDFKIDSLMRYASNSKLSKEAAVLVLFGVLDDEPSASADFDGCPECVGENLDVLLLVRADTLRSHAGQPAFPGGKIDPEDYELARQQRVPVGRIAALREAVEETGLDPAGVEILGELPTLPLAVSDFRVTPVLGWWASPTRVGVVDTNESALIARVPVRDLLNPANRHTAYVKRGRITHKTPAFEVMHSSGDARVEFTVWGFTAIVLDKIFDALAWTVPWDDSVLKPAPALK